MYVSIGLSPQELTLLRNKLERFTYAQFNIFVISFFLRNLRKNLRNLRKNLRNLRKNLRHLNQNPKLSPQEFDWDQAR